MSTFLVFTTIALTYEITSIPEQSTSCQGRDLSADMTTDVLKQFDAFLAVTAAARKLFLVAYSNISVKNEQNTTITLCNDTTFLAAAA